MHRMPFRVTLGMSALLCAAAIAVPSASAAPGLTSSATPYASDVAAAITRAEATGREGTVLQYQPATQSWSQVTTVGNPLEAPGQQFVAEPDSFTSTVACLLASWSLAACANIAVNYESVLSPDSPAATIVKGLESTGEDELKLNRLVITKWEELNETLEGVGNQIDQSVAGGFSAAATGFEDGVEDIGAGCVFVTRIGSSWFYIRDEILVEKKRSARPGGGGCA